MSTDRLWVPAALLSLMLMLFGLAVTSAQDGAGRKALVMQIEGTIGPMAGEYFRSGLRQAESIGAGLVVLRLDTPGGLDAAMRDIVKDILAAQVPVACFVSPSGARAASAGTYILYACHIAAMAPATNLGSATPVKIGGFPGLPERDTPEEPAGPEDQEAEKEEAETDGPTPAEPTTADGESDSGSSMERKIINDAAAFIRGLAKLRGRNAEWAEQAVREAENLTADEALERGVIDLVAESLDDLLKKIDGREVRVIGEAVTLDTADAVTETFEPDWRIRVLTAITDPNIAYVLLLIGVYGLIYELANPGAMVPGVIGAIALITALFAFQALPVNYAGLALLVLGVGFMVLEAFVPSFGALGIGGAIAFVIGSVILFRDESGQIGVAIPLIATFAILSMALFIGVVGYAVKTRLRPVVSGREEMLNAIGIAEEDFAESGRVHVHSETWNAKTRQPLRKGQKVRVVGLEGLELTVEPAAEPEEED